MEDEIPIDSFKSFFLWQLATAILVSCLALLIGKGPIAWSFVVGVALMTFSLMSLGMAVYLGFYKKNIALLIGVIVFKLPILIYVVYKLVESFSLSFLHLAAGYGVWVLPSILWLGFQKTKQE